MAQARIVRPPEVLAVERVAKLALQGAPLARVIHTSTEIVLAWQREGLEAGDLRDRLEAVQADLDSGMEQAENYAGEAETAGQQKAALAQLEAIAAARQIVTTALLGLS